MAERVRSLRGIINCEMLDNDRIAISGEAALVAISDIKADLR